MPMKIKERIARIIYREHMGPHSESYDADVPYGSHTIDARLSADGIMYNFWVIPKPYFWKKGR